MKILSLAFLSIAFLFQLPTDTIALSNDSDEAKIISVRMYADWCGNCKILDEKLATLKHDFDGQQILFLQLDQTDEFRTRQAAMLASKLNLDSVWNEYIGRTGMMLLVNAETGELLEEITHTWDSDKINETIEKYLRD